MAAARAWVNAIASATMMKDTPATRPVTVHDTPSRAATGGNGISLTEAERRQREGSAKVPPPSNGTGTSSAPKKPTKKKEEDVSVDIMASDDEDDEDEAFDDEEDVSEMFDDLQDSGDASVVTASGDEEADAMDIIDDDDDDEEENVGEAVVLRKSPVVSQPTPVPGANDTVRALYVLLEKWTNLGSRITSGLSEAASSTDARDPLQDIINHIHEMERIATLGDLPTPTPAKPTSTPKKTKKDRPVVDTATLPVQAPPVVKEKKKKTTATRAEAVPKKKARKTPAGKVSSATGSNTHTAMATTSDVIAATLDMDIDRGHASLKDTNVAMSTPSPKEKPRSKKRPRSAVSTEVPTEHVVVAETPTATKDDERAKKKAKKSAETEKTDKEKKRERKEKKKRKKAEKAASVTRPDEIKTRTTPAPGAITKPATSATREVYRRPDISSIGYDKRADDEKSPPFVIAYGTAYDSIKRAYAILMEALGQQVENATAVVAVAQSLRQVTNRTELNDWYARMGKTAWAVLRAVCFGLAVRSDTISSNVNMVNVTLRNPLLFMTMTRLVNSVSSSCVLRLTNKIAFAPDTPSDITPLQLRNLLANKHDGLPVEIIYLSGAIFGEFFQTLEAPGETLTDASVPLLTSGDGDSNEDEGPVDYTPEDFQ